MCGYLKRRQPFVVDGEQAHWPYPYWGQSKEGEDMRFLVPSLSECNARTNEVPPYMWYASKWVERSVFRVMDLRSCHDNPRAT